MLVKSSAQENDNMGKLSFNYLIIIIDNKRNHRTINIS